MIINVGKTQDDYLNDGKKEYTLADILADPGAVFKATIYSLNHNEGLYYSYCNNQLQVSKDAYDEDVVRSWVTSNANIQVLLKMRFRIEY